MAECVLCVIIARERPGFIIKETEQIAVLLSLEGHPLVVPKKHIEDVFEIDDQCAAAVMREAVSVSIALKSVCKCDGINLVQSNGPAAGQDVFHFHLHVKPRWLGDNVVLTWDTSPMEEGKKLELAEDLHSYFGVGR